MYDLTQNQSKRAIQLPIEPVHARTRKVALLGNFPPRRCGIATFTADLQAALDGVEEQFGFDVVAMSDDVYDYDDKVMGEVRQDILADYAAIARRLNTEADLVCIQHEFGIFGGPAGSHLLHLLAALRVPVVTTLHTVLEQPNDDQRRVMDGLIRHSAKLVVLSRKGRDILMRAYGVPVSKIEVIPHGAPDRPLIDTAEMKPRFDMAGRDVLLTFGLLSPGKGIEDAIRAMPRVVETSPNALYVILGATHPSLVKREGESYRESLQNLAEELGVADNVRFVNEYVDLDRLCDYLQAADVYVTPYLNAAQVVSGTLTYAVALGKPVVSTPYWHATEIAGEGCGLIVPFRDSAAMGDAIASLLNDDAKRRHVAECAYELGRDFIWPRVAQRYLEAFEAAREQARTKPEVRVAPLPTPSLIALERLSDDVGILQHGRFAVPDRNHGYCVDDNARALLFTQRAEAAGMRSPALEKLAYTYAAFVEHAWNADNGRFRNFMSFDRRWLEEEGSADSFGRTFWALGETAALARDADLRAWALHLAGRALPHLDAMLYPRSRAFAVLGLCAVAPFGLAGALENLEGMSGALMRTLEQNRRPDWDWFEPSLAYDNARLPEALLRAGASLNDAAMRAAGLATLCWLTEVHTAPSGVFRPVGSESFNRPHQPPLPFDQQALEAAAAIDACWAAFDVTGDAAWRREAHRAFAWYFGRNDLGLAPASSESGGCHDGLCPVGVNRNQGAESVLSFQLASCAMRAREKVRQVKAAC
ncbi:glycosyltransferase family 4 protein [Terricaulis sp.]|uniref:glycosyltransferase family 4 protein n=1 Tax=Terricaulis sp. TaxID=2768686 RepID=UPI003782EC00